MNRSGVDKHFKVDDLTQLGISLAEFTRRSGLSFHTLKRMDAGDPTVQPVTWNKARRVMAALRAELQIPARGPRQASGA